MRRPIKTCLPILMLGLLLLAFYPAWAQQDRVWHLVALEGEVQVRPSPGAAFRPAKLRDQLGPGAALETKRHGKAKLFLPMGGVLALGPESALEIGNEASSPSREFSVKLTKGTLQFFGDLAPPQGSYHLTLGTAASLVEIRRGAGFLISTDQDRLIVVEGPALVLTNRASGHSLTLRPLQAAMSHKDGLVELSSTKAGELDMLLAQTQVAPAAPPPPAVLKPPLPPQTPITLADQVRQPWPVFPPVIQSPNIWILETPGRPKPRR